MCYRAFVLYKWTRPFLSLQRTTFYESYKDTKHAFFNVDFNTSTIILIFFKLAIN